jgi:hypothetical protein
MDPPYCDLLVFSMLEDQSLAVDRKAACVGIPNDHNRAGKKIQVAPT